MWVGHAPAAGAATSGRPRADVVDREPTLDVLEPAENEGYLNWVLPTARDAEIAALVDALTASPGRGPRPSHLQRRVLLAYAERMAVLARRESSPDRLRSGLAAVAITADDDDARDAIPVQALLWRSAEVLGLDPADEFTRVAREVGDQAGFVEFTTRGPDDRSIDAMGYVEVEDPDLGFTYERTW